MADVPATTPPMPPSANEPEIHVIPEKYFGAALRAKAPSEGGKPGDPNAIVQPSRNAAVPYIVLATVVLLSGAGGAFVYFNKDKLFPPKTQPVIVEPPAPPPPAPSVPTAAANLIATSTNPQSASLSWADMSSNESGFRVERAQDSGPYQSLTNLPPNSTSFLDVAVQSGTTYRYRIFAVNEGGDSPPSQEAIAAVSSPPPPAPPPPEQPKLPPAGLDADADGLTDLEEKLMGSDAQYPDSDSDGFLDGNEVFNLYNPNGRAPGRLIDAGLVRTISYPIGWTMQVPTAWKLSADTMADGSKATIEIDGPEKFIVSIERNPNKLSIVDWYVSLHADTKVETLRKFISKKGYEGIIGPDLLTTYIPWGDFVFTFKYELSGQPFINYRTLYSMMLNSLMLSGLPAASAADMGTTPLPFEPAPTTTGMVTQPEAVETPGGAPTGGAPSGSAPSGGAPSGGAPSESAPGTNPSLTPSSPGQVPPPPPGTGAPASVPPSAPQGSSAGPSGSAP